MIKEFLTYHPEDMHMPAPAGTPIVEPCKTIVTRDISGNVNGYVVEVAKNYTDLVPNEIEGDRAVETTVYLTTVDPHMMKGYHGHTFRTSTYTLIFGEAEIHILDPEAGRLHIYEIDAEEAPYRTITPPGHFLALKSRNGKMAAFVGVPNPPFHSEVREQTELDPALVRQAIQDGRITEIRYLCTRDGLVQIGAGTD